MFWDHGFAWTGWLMMALAMAGLWVLLALLAFAVVRGGRGSGGDLDAHEILERRLARGEIGTEEYQQRLDALDQVAR